MLATVAASASAAADALPEALPVGTVPGAADEGAGGSDGLGSGDEGVAGSDAPLPVRLLTCKPCDPDRCQSCMIGKARH
eukprot:2927381-Lingulodinium_polyedra.AAC.1